MIVDRTSIRTHSAWAAPPIEKALKAFEATFVAVIDSCNGCHAAMDYGFIKVVKMKTPANVGINYAVKSQPGDVPK